MTSTPLSSMLLVLFASVVGSFGAGVSEARRGRLTGLMSLLNWRARARGWPVTGSSVFYGLESGMGSFPLRPPGRVGILDLALARCLSVRAVYTRSKLFGLGLVLARRYGRLGQLRIGRTIVSCGLISPRFHSKTPTDSTRTQTIRPTCGYTSSRGVLYASQASTRAFAPRFTLVACTSLVCLT